MMLDKKAVDMLLTLDDAKLSLVIQKLASEAGISPSNINLGPAELGGIRSALKMATNEDLQKAAEILKNYKNGAKS